MKPNVFVMLFVTGKVGDLASRSGPPPSARSCRGWRVAAACGGARPLCPDGAPAPGLRLRAPQKYPVALARVGGQHCGIWEVSTWGVVLLEPKTPYAAQDGPPERDPAQRQGRELRDPAQTDWSHCNELQLFSLGSFCFILKGH